jgi:hypothetical protein
MERERGGGVVDLVLDYQRLESGKSLGQPLPLDLREVWREAANRATFAIRTAEETLPDWFRAQGKTVMVPDRAAFRAAALPLHNDESAGAGWTRAQYDRLQALGARTN